MEDQRKIFKGIIPPPILFLALVLIGFAAQRLFPVNLIFHEWPFRLIVVFPSFIASGMIAVNALLMMRKHKTAITFNQPTTKFIKEGSFRFTRNPLYLALLLLMFSIAVVSNSAWHLISVILLFLLLNFGVVAREEQYLEKIFGEEYIQYKKNVRRWV